MKKLIVFLMLAITTNCLAIAPQSEFKKMIDEPDNRFNELRLMVKSENYNKEFLFKKFFKKEITKSNYYTRYNRYWKAVDIVLHDLQNDEFIYNRVFPDDEFFKTKIKNKYRITFRDNRTTYPNENKTFLDYDLNSVFLVTKIKDNYVSLRASNSPYLFNQFLIINDLLGNHPQKLDSQSLYEYLYILQLLNNNERCIGFNGMGAKTINHAHAHCYTERKLKLELSTRRYIARYENINVYMVDGELSNFMIEGKDIDNVCKVAMTYINETYKNNYLDVNLFMRYENGIFRVYINCCFKRGNQGFARFSGHIIVMGDISKQKDLEKYDKYLEKTSRIELENNIDRLSNKMIMEIYLDANEKLLYKDNFSEKLLLFISKYSIFKSYNKMLNINFVLDTIGLNISENDLDNLTFEQSNNILKAV